MTLPAIAEITHDDTRVVLQLTLDPSLAVFQGHFPEMPILPGVAQIDWVMLMAERYFGLTPAGQDFQIKFTNMIRPGMALILTLAFDTAKGQIAFEYKVGETSMSNGRVKIVAAS